MHFQNLYTTLTLVFYYQRSFLKIQHNESKWWMVDAVEFRTFIYSLILYSNEKMNACSQEIRRNVVNVVK